MRTILLLAAVLAVALPALTHAGDGAKTDAARKDELMRSERWKKIVYELNDYLKVQRKMSPEEKRTFIAKLNQQVRKLDSQQFEGLMDEMDQKLAILMSPEMQSARGWLGEYMSAMADGYREEFIKTLPDPRTLSPEELEKELAALKTKLENREKSQTAFATEQEVKVKRATDLKSATAQASREAAARLPAAAAEQPFRSQYDARRFDNVPNPGPRFSESFYLGAGAGITFDF